MIRLVNDGGTKDLECLDYGEMFLYGGSTKYRAATLKNESDRNITLTITTKSLIDSPPIKVLIISAADCHHINETTLALMAVMDQNEIILERRSEIKVWIIVSCQETLQQLSPPKSKSTFSYQNVSTQVLVGTNEGSENLVNLTAFSINVSLCISMMEVDETEVEFDSCSVGSNYVRDVQVWNRSECFLNFKLIPLSESAGNCPLLFSDFETSQTLQFHTQVSIPPFSSKRFQRDHRNVLGVSLH